MIARALCLLALAALLGACGEDPKADIQMQIESSPPTDPQDPTTHPLMRGIVEGYDGTIPGHYDFWARLANDEVVRANRFVIVPASAYDAPRHLAPLGAPQVRDYDTNDFLGYVNSNCSLGPCGGIRFLTDHDLGDAVQVFITREPEGDDDEVPADDVLLRGPVQPYARDSLRGSLGNPAGALLPRGEVTILLVHDGATL